jgi:hypothetical protein
MSNTHISRWNHNIGLCDPKYSLVLRDNRITKKILSLLKIKSQDDNLVFPFFSFLNSNYIIGAYRSKPNKKEGYIGLKGCANDYLYPLCVPNVELDNTKTLNLVKSPLAVAKYLSDDKNAIAYCRQDKISASLIEYIVNNNIKEIKCVGFKRMHVLKSKLHEYGHDCLITS